MYLDCYKYMYISKTLLKCKINAKIFIWQLKKKKINFTESHKCMLASYNIIMVIP